MSRSPRVAAGLWLVLAFVVFNVTYDWKIRAAGTRFAHAQIVRHAQGLPPRTINQDFRPMVRAAARQSLVWFVVIATTGAIAVTIARGRDAAAGYDG